MGGLITFVFTQKGSLALKIFAQVHSPYTPLPYPPTLHTLLLPFRVNF